MIRVLGITAILFLGCATGQPRSSSTAGKLSLEQAEQRVDQSEEKCIEDTATRADSQLSNIVTSLGALGQMQVRAVFLQRDYAWSQCLVSADQGREAIAVQERAQYQNVEALDRKVPLPVLTMSLTR